MPVFHENILQGSAEWLAFRKDKITATDIAIICGVNPFKSPYMLWMEKLGLKDPDPENDAMRRGKELEPIALEKYCDISQRNFNPCVVTHSHYPWAMASIDAMDDIEMSTYRICEIKCMGKKNHDEAMNGYVNPLYNAQMQWQMFITELSECDYFVYSEDSHRIISVNRDQTLIEEMIVKANEFLEMLRTLTPPPFTDLDYEDKSEDPQWDNYMAYYADYDKMEKDAKAGKEHIKKILIDLANGRNCKGSNSKFTSYLQKGRVDYDAIPELQGVDLDKYRKPDTQCYRITFNKD